MRCVHTQLGRHNIILPQRAKNSIVVVIYITFYLKNVFYFKGKEDSLEYALCPLSFYTYISLERTSDNTVLEEFFVGVCKLLKLQVTFVEKKYF